MPARHRSLLTPTQWLVLARVAAGADNAAIGLALGIRPGTVVVHMRAIYQRLPPVSGRRSKRAAAIGWYQTAGRARHEWEANAVDEQQQAAWRAPRRRAELDQIDRTLQRVDEGFALVATFLADWPEAEAVHVEALRLAERTKALRERCDALQG